MAQQYADDAFLVALYPEAADVDQVQRERWLEFAKGIVHLSYHENNSDDAHASMTMHLLALQPGAPPGLQKAKIGSMSLGPGSISYVTQAVTDQGLELTRYGQHYKLLRDAKVSVVWVA